jgi:predicted DCC family thiol-disulfide oxidoreductase YuxK
MRFSCLKNRSEAERGLGERAVVGRDSADRLNETIELSSMNPSEDEWRLKAELQREGAMKLLEAYVDGDCALCRRMRAAVERRDRAGCIEWLDLRDQAALARATPLKREELAAQMHVRRLRDGVWFRGFDAWLEILDVLPRWRAVARLLSFSPCRAIGRALYRFIARHRYGFSAMGCANGACGPKVKSSLHQP